MQPAIEVTRVNKKFGTIRALDDINLKIETGEFFALLGPNGAGKTTLISIIAGLALADGGTVSIMGHDVMTQYPDARRNLGVVPQELVFDPFFSVRETLTIQSGYYGIKNNHLWIDEIIQRLGLDDKADNNMRTLSGGMKRRVLVAQSLVHKPPVIILDEPTAGVDVELRQTLWDFIQQLNKAGHTIVLTTHYLQEAEALCNRVAMLKQGEIVALDSMQNLIGSMTTGYTLRLKLSVDYLPTELERIQISYHNGLHDLKLQSCNQVESILQTLRQADIQVLDMQLLQPDLEEVFVKIMRESRVESV